jgi:iron complex transport system ATP-binding protein
VIAFDGIHARYAGAPRAAVEDVTFTAARSAFTAVVGPNGSGKSTIVRALLRRVPLSGGRILVDGAPLESIERRTFARRVAVVPQREEPVFGLTVREYVALGRYPHEGLWPRSHDAEPVIERALALAEVEGFRSRSILELSGGEWQRVRIARALAQGGDALVMDEPTTFLDIAHEMATFELLAALARSGTAVLMVSHELNLVARFADQIVLLAGGTVAAAGTAADVMRADVLEHVYEWPIVVTRDPAVGALALLPLRSTRRTLSRPHDPQ